MSGFRRIWLPITLALLVSAARAQDEVGELLQDARQYLRTGVYDQAEELLGELGEERPSDPAVVELQSRYLILRGRFEEAARKLRAVLAIHPDRAVLEALLGEALMRRGSYEEAGVLLERAWQARPPVLRAGRLLGECRRARGDRAGARESWQAVLRRAAETAPHSSADLYEVGKCNERLRRLVPASHCYAEAARADPSDPAPHAALGNLNRIVYHDAPGFRDPARDLQEALKRNPLHLEANTVLYVLYGDNFRRDQRKRARWKRNIERVNPRHVPLLLREARELMRNRRFADAGVKIRAALQVNAADPWTRAFEAVHAFIGGDEKRFARIEQELLAADPHDGEFYELLGSTIVDLYRFAEAIPYLRKAIELEPALFDARLVLGQALANTGELRAGLEELKQSKKAVPGILHPWRENMITAFSALLDEYVVVKHWPFVFYFHPDGRAVYEEYMVPVYQQALKVLARKYGIEPPLPVYVQCFHDFQDFSARTVGFTGFGALGVCFGNTITAVAPLAPEFRDHFSWRSTAWHEFAHVITIALSKTRIPRWLTEGLSTFEEKQLNPGYDRHMELQLVDAFHNDEIYPVARLNEAFRTRRIIFGYYQGGLICEYLAREYSFPRIAQMVRLYGEDRSTSEIFKTCFGLSTAEFDRRFHEYIRARIAPIRVVPNLRGRRLEILRERVSDDPGDCEAAELLAWQELRRPNLADAELILQRVFRLRPDHPRGWLLKGQLLLARGDPTQARAAFERGFEAGGEEFTSRLRYAALLERDGRLKEAEIQLRKAAEDFPTCAQAGSSPLLRLYRLLLAQGREEEAHAEIEHYCTIDGSAFDPRMSLGRYLAEQHRWEDADRIYREANYIDPFSRELHIRWAAVLRKLERFPQARREYRMARAFDASMDHSRLRPRGAAGEAPWGLDGIRDETAFRSETLALEAEVFLLEKDAAGARRAGLRALEINPANQRARAVLKAVGGG